MRKRWFTPSFETSAKDTSSVKRKIMRTNSDTSDHIESPISALPRKCSDVLEKYQPITIDELVIHPKKVKEVEMGLLNCFSTGSEDKKYLLLSGPNGCGKTLTLHLVAKSLQINVVEWLTPLDRDSVVTDTQGITKYFGQIASNYETFDYFLWHASRYGSLTTHSSLKVILIKDFPHTFSQKPESFHILMKKYYALKTCPIIFICNDDNLCRTLFPEHVRVSCAIQTIVFNPVNCTAVIKALKRVAELEFQSSANFSVPSAADLRKVYEETGGDLRSALLKLYFNAAKPLASKEHIPASVSHDCEHVSANELSKDQSADLFKLLGRILYSKRRCKYKEGTSFSSKNYEFTHNPDEIAKTISFQPFLFMGFLQGNYVSRFSCLNSIALAADKFSFADILLKQHNQETEVIAVTLIIRYLMVLNQNPKKSFAPFVKPKVYNEMLATDLLRNVRNSFSLFHLPSSELIMFVLPLLRTSLLSLFDLNESQRKLIGKSLSHSGGGE